jgi:AhpD family alkylhydroperoxidase
MIAALRALDDGEEQGVRLSYRTALPAAMSGMLALQRAVDDGTLEPRLLELVKLRASQINGCAHCLEMHSKDARAIGEDEQRLHLLAAWREAPCYDARERAALAWCESLTRVSETGAPDSDYAPLREVFSDEEIAVLTYAIVAINGWNRLAVGLRAPVGGYVSRRVRPAGPRDAAG